MTLRSRDVEWQLQSLQTTGGSFVIDRPESFTLELRENGELAVQADCNGCFGSYELLPGNQIRINEPMACTAAYCPLSAPLDTAYVALLAASTNYLATPGRADALLGSGSAALQPLKAGVDGQRARHLGSAVPAIGW